MVGGLWLCVRLLCSNGTFYIGGVIDGALFNASAKITAGRVSEHTCTHATSTHMLPRKHAFQPHAYSYSSRPCRDANRHKHRQPAKSQAST